MIIKLTNIHQTERKWYHWQNQYHKLTMWKGNCMIFLIPSWHAVTAMYAYFAVTQYNVSISSAKSVHFGMKRPLIRKLGRWALYFAATHNTGNRLFLLYLHLQDNIKDFVIPVLSVHPLLRFPSTVESLPGPTAVTTAGSLPTSHSLVFILAEQPRLCVDMYCPNTQRRWPLPSSRKKMIVLS